jgi:hypothetical protein
LTPFSVLARVDHSWTVFVRLAWLPARPADIFHSAGEAHATRAYVSHDAGKTWKASPLPGENVWDPVVAFTARGTALFLNLPGKGLSVFRSRDGGATWEDRVELAYTMVPMTAVDWTNGERRGHIYIAGRGGGRAKAPFVVRRSADDGRTFETTVVLQEPHLSVTLNPIVLRDGTLFVPFSTVLGKDGEQIEFRYDSHHQQAGSNPP